MSSDNRLSAAQLSASLEEANADDTLREMAREHDQDAIGVLAAAVSRKGGKGKAPWSVSVNAASKLIELGHGRSATQSIDTGGGDLHVTINKFAGSAPVERELDPIDVAKVVHEAPPEGTAEALEAQLDLGVVIKRGKRNPSS